MKSILWFDNKKHMWCVERVDQSSKKQTTRKTWTTTRNSKRMAKAKPAKPNKQTNKQTTITKTPKGCKKDAYPTNPTKKNIQKTSQPFNNKKNTKNDARRIVWMVCWIRFAVRCWSWNLVPSMIGGWCGWDGIGGWVWMGKDWGKLRGLLKVFGWCLCFCFCVFFYFCAWICRYFLFVDFRWKVISLQWEYFFVISWMLQRVEEFGMDVTFLALNLGCPPAQ